jgi:lipopolysaccharide transport system ATP-binding protein
MSADAAIRVEGLGKKYVIGHENRGAPGGTLRDALVRTANGFARVLKDTAHGRAIVAGDTTEEFWALKNVSFEVSRGEVVGIIGRNGAGKSTLLKVLSRITEPTEGRIEIRGRVASLLEVGTGFHPELTGRENIYLNGAILGMSRAEVRGKFDRIVDFADVERFLDTPVKRYSSGMHVRLAFAVAAHLDPEILVVDEVLAVGDAEFQRKCLGKMQSVAGEGRTVLFVSHNLQAVERLCRRGLLLQDGLVNFDGPAVAACRRYAAGTRTWDFASRLKADARQGDGRARITRLDVLDSQGRPTRVLSAGEPLRIRMRYFASEPLRSPTFGFTLLTAAGVRVFNTISDDSCGKLQSIEGEGAVEFEVQGLTFARGSYCCNIAIVDRRGVYCDYMTDVPLLEMDGLQDLSPARAQYDQASGVIFSNARWKACSLESQHV